VDAANRHEASGLEPDANLAGWLRSQRPEVVDRYLGELEDRGIAFEDDDINPVAVATPTGLLPAPGPPPSPLVQPPPPGEGRPWVPIERRFAPQASPPYHALFPPAPAAGRAHNSTAGGRNRASNTGHGDFLLGRPPVNTQPPQGIKISMCEIMTFCPSWLQIPDVVMRAIRNGYSRKLLAKMQLQPMGRLNRRELEKASTRIQQQFS